MAQVGQQASTGQSPLSTAPHIPIVLQSQELVAVSPAKQTETGEIIPSPTKAFVELYVEQVLKPQTAAESKGQFTIAPQAASNQQGASSISSPLKQDQFAMIEQSPEIKTHHYQASSQVQQPIQVQSPNNPQKEEVFFMPVETVTFPQSNQSGLQEKEMGLHGQGINPKHRLGNN